MLLRPWLCSVRESLRRPSRPVRRSKAAGLAGSERLEDRTLLSVSSSFNPLAAELSVTSDADDAIQVSANAGQVMVNGQPTGVMAGDVQHMVVNGGPGANAIDMSGVLPADFTHLQDMQVHGGDGADSITGSPFDDAIHGDAGQDMISGHAGHDWLDGGVGDDTVDGGAGDDVIYGDAGYPGGTSAGEPGAAGNDTLSGGAGHDQIFGEDGNDVLPGGSGTNLLDGGNGADS